MRWFCYILPQLKYFGTKAFPKLCKPVLSTNTTFVALTFKIFQLSKTWRALCRDENEDWDVSCVSAKFIWSGDSPGLWMQSESHVGLGTNTVIGVSTAQEIVYSNVIFKWSHDQDGWCSGTFPCVQRRGKTLQQLQESATVCRSLQQLQETRNSSADLQLTT